MSANGLSSVPLSWKNITVRLGQLKPWDHNPRQSTEKQSRALVRSWDKFGQVHLFAVDPVFNVIDGHQRLTGLLLDHGPDFRVEARQSNRQLTDAEQRELSVTLHQGAVGHWDWDELGKWDGVDLVDWGFDGDTLTDWTRDVGALNNLLESEKPEPPDDPGAQIDKAEELREKWQTETGQLWIIPSATGDGEHRIICGDCTAAEVVARVMGGEKEGEKEGEGMKGRGRGLKQKKCHDCFFSSSCFFSWVRTSALLLMCRESPIVSQFPCFP